MADSNRLWTILGPRRGAVIAAALTASLVLNAVALLPGVPFLQISGVLAPGPYSILKVIELLWESGLYPLVALVVGFSVVFPPAKLAIAAWALWARADAARRACVLSWLGVLGRWSLLDVFVCLLIVLVLSEQGLTGARVAAGLYCFLGAIVLSMAASGVLHRAAVRSSDDVRGDAPVEGVRRPWLAETSTAGAVAACVALVGFVSVAGSFSEIMFRVDQFGLWGNEWSLRGAIGHLFEHRLVPFGVAMLAFLVVAPALAMLLLIATLCVPLSPAGRLSMLHRTRAVLEWSMLDVFALALMLYLVEQENFAKLDLEPGAWYVFASATVFTAGVWSAERVLRGRLDG